LSLRDVAEATKLSTTTLRHIEQDEFEWLPAGIYAKGYLRAFATIVGLDADVIVHDYVAQRIDSADGDHPPAPAPPPARTAHAMRDLAIAAMTIVIAILSYQVFGPTPRPVAIPEEQTANAVLEPARYGDTVAATATDAETATDAAPASASDTQPAATDGDALRLDIVATGECWVSVVADGEQVVYQLLQQGDRVTAVAQRELRLHIGDPGTFGYAINGATGRPLGRPGKPASIVITPDNYQSLL
jgi:cytoskeleton protein RodZ